ncbi:kyphoscoliosis peptidase-like isoform X1 [Mytilus galloprovincialis]|uniref:kyphoscoliosis peptidase-like isoform X1 n=2 Tax=Mytilus galloprovincialis TaxID=29158 RepID=UPI003F7C8816
MQTTSSVNIIKKIMGCGTSINSVVPLQYFENANGSALRINCPGSDILDYVSADEIKEADERVEQLSPSEASIDILSENLCQNTKNKVICVRLFFKWIVNNIRYDPNSQCTDVNSILNSKRGSSEGFANLFEHMCSFKNIKVIRLNSCMKSYSFILDYEKLDNKYNVHVWNAVLIDNIYHHVDCTWGALPVSDQKYGTDGTEQFFFTSTDVIGDLC